MSPDLSIFDHGWVRFSTCGTLLTLRCVVDAVNRRRGRRGAPSPRWAHVLLTVTLLVFYGFIRPAGGALLAGYGNLAGIGLVLLSLTIGLAGPIPGSLVLGRTLFYLSLPIAVGVPWGLAVLSLPTVTTGFWVQRTATQGLPAEAA